MQQVFSARGVLNFFRQFRRRQRACRDNVQAVVCAGQIRQFAPFDCDQRILAQFFFDFLRKLCEDKKLIVVAISHDVRFFDYADKCYLVADGYVKELSKDDEVVLEEETTKE